MHTLSVDVTASEPKQVCLAATGARGLGISGKQSLPRVKS